MYDNSNKRTRRPLNGNSAETTRQKGTADYDSNEYRQRQGFTPNGDRNRSGYNRNDGERNNRGGQYNNNQFGRNRPAARTPARNRPPKEESKIYFIALLPTAEVGKEIIRLKQEFAENYTARHALRVLPHITMQVPFTASPALEKGLCTELMDFAATLAPFEIRLDGFGSFPFDARRVLYIHVEKSEAIVQMHRQMVAFLRKEFGFSSMLARHGFTPHISVAFNDLSAPEFSTAWQEYEHKPFKASFRVNNLYLLRHSGTSWEVLQKCKLGN